MAYFHFFVLSLLFGKVLAALPAVPQSTNPISLSIDKLTEALQLNQCNEKTWSNLINRLIGDVENSISLHRKMSKTLSELQQKVLKLSEELNSGGNSKGSVYFSVATSKRVHCYDCVIQYEIVSSNPSHFLDISILLYSWNWWMTHFQFKL